MSAFADKLKSILIGIDEAAASLLFEHSNMTISARCGMALVDRDSGVYSPNRPHKVEEKFLVALAAVLDAVDKHHCYSAVPADIARAKETIALLEPYAEACMAAMNKKPEAGDEPQD